MRLEVGGKGYGMGSRGNQAGSGAVVKRQGKAVRGESEVTVETGEKNGEKRD